ncbi:retron St85 family effector protein [Providencia vermicola]|uniref:retron St85 family effector protein n=1 Tax=Providencia vermicola TaxID=333965 RepID=UPI0032DBA358
MKKEDAYENALLSQFEKLNPSVFTVEYLPALVFVCGGPCVIDSKNPPVYDSLRDRIFTYTAAYDDELYSSLVLAENFHDYFKDGAYENLMQFEDDIASVSTLIIICLESAGSLVELGLFCNKKSLANKLLVFAPSEETESESSFIFLGPISSLQKIDERSVSIYPWPTGDSIKYPHIEHVVGDIKERLRNIKKTERFNIKNQGHLAILINEIILLAFPIKIGEIEFALYSMNIDIESKVISRLLYLLNRLKLISNKHYSGVSYYYPCDGKKSRVKFGKSSEGKIVEFTDIKVAMRQSFLMADILDSDERARKRRNVLSIIDGDRHE